MPAGQRQHRKARQQQGSRRDEPDERTWFCSGHKSFPVAAPPWRTRGITHPGPDC